MILTSGLVVDFFVGEDFDSSEDDDSVSTIPTCEDDDMTRCRRRGEVVVKPSATTATMTSHNSMVGTAIDFIIVLCPDER